MAEKKWFGRVGLAPMAGVTDAPYRVVCRELGADFTVSEMVSAKAIHYRDKKTDKLMRLEVGERPAGIQLFGHEPDLLAEAVEKCMAFSPDFLDLNAGCPVPKIAGNGDGSALMKDPALLERCVSALVKASPVPVSVKMRLGWNAERINAADCARACETAGAAMVAVHGRTKEQMYRPSADWAGIAAVRQAVSIPLYGNGDVTSGADALRLLKETGCDGLLIGRAAMGDPWIFEEVQAALNGQPIPPRPSLPERMRVARIHLGGLVVEKGDRIGVLESRKHLAWYLHGVRGAGRYRDMANRMETPEELYALLELIAEEGSLQ